MTWWEWLLLWLVVMVVLIRWFYIIGDRHERQQERELTQRTNRPPHL